MRTSGNPIKEKPGLGGYKRHRIIMPVYIPDQHGYYQDAFKIFEICLDSLIKTTNRETVNITIINNACIPEVDELVRNKLAQGLIDQYVVNQINRGKADAIVGAAKASYEPFITFADADVLFYSGWLEEIEKIYVAFPQTGAVSPFPTPHLKFMLTASIWFNRFFSIKKAKIVSDDDFILFEESVGISGFFKSPDISQQYYLAKGEVKAVVGAGHFVCTLRREIIKNLDFEATNLGLKGGLRTIDKQVDLCGMFRLSLPYSMVYHMGNVLSLNDKVKQRAHSSSEPAVVEKLQYSVKRSRFIPYGVKILFLRAAQVLNKLKIL